MNRWEVVREAIGRRGAGLQRSTAQFAWMS